MGMSERTRLYGLKRGDIAPMEVWMAYHLSLASSPRVWPSEILAQSYPIKVAYRAMEREFNKGNIEYGVSLRSGWLDGDAKEAMIG